MPATALQFTVRLNGRRIGILDFTASRGWSVPGLDGAFPNRDEAIAAIRANAGLDRRDLLTYDRTR
jgi:hypothetical protein